MSDRELGIGDRVGGRYRVRRLIARGGMGEVFEATDEAAEGARVAIKVIRPEYARDAEWRARFKREIAIAAALESPHIPRLLQAGKTQAGRRWIAFEYLDGETLEARLERDRAIPFRELAWMVEHVLMALQVAHGAGVVHRDVKPANLFLVRDGPRLCVLDFGVAKAARTERPTSGLTSVEDTLGTPSYMSPEQLVSPKDVDARADLFSAGAVAYRALAGRTLFPAHRAEDHAGPRGFPSVADATGLAYPEAVEGWFERMVARRPDERFASASAACDAWKLAVRSMQGVEPAPIRRGYVHEDTDLAPLPEPRGAPTPASSSTPADPTIRRR